jgi:hypothetical protein
MRLHQRIDVDAAIGTPMAAMKGHSNRSPVQELVEADHLRGFVGQKEWGHRLADLRCRLSCPILMKPRYESIHCSGKFRSTAPYRLSKGAKLLAQRYVQVTHTPESVVQALSLDIRVHGNVSPQAFAVPSLEPNDSPEVRHAVDSVVDRLSH